MANGKFVERELLIFLRRVCRRISRHFGLHYRAVHLIDKRRADHKIVMAQTVEGDQDPRRYIEICIKTPTGRYYTVPQLVRTLSHELAHVATWQEQPMHGKEWKQWFRKIRTYTFNALV